MGMHSLIPKSSFFIAFSMQEYCKRKTGGVEVCMGMRQGMQLRNTLICYVTWAGNEI